MYFKAILANMSQFTRFYHFFPEFFEFKVICHWVPSDMGPFECDNVDALIYVIPQYPHIHQNVIQAGRQTACVQAVPIY